MDKLPEKWCIKITNDNLSYLKSLKNKELHFSHNYNYSIGAYYSAIKYCDGSYAGWNIFPGFTEITLEEFKKFITNKIIIWKNK